MNQNNEFLADVLRRAARALAGYAARGLLDAYPQAGRSFQPDPFAGWQNWLAGRIEDLAAAVAVDRPSLFISQMHWGKTVLQSRGVAPETFRRGIVCLRDVLAGELPEQVQSLAGQYVDRALEAFDDPSREFAERLSTETEMGRLAAFYLLVLLEGDRRRAGRLVLDALDAGHDARDLYGQVLMPAQQELGRMWMAGEINVAEEHFVSQTTRVVMAQLLPRATFRPPNGKTMLAASVAGNQHDIGLQAVADFFEMDGWRTILLGADVPHRDLVQAVDCFQADLLGLSVSQPTQLDAAKTAIGAVRGDGRETDVKILLGGRALLDSDGLCGDLGGNGYAADPAEAVALGRQLVGIEP